MYDYGVTGKISKITYADGRSVELSYDPLKQLREMRDWLGTTIMKSDALGRTTEVTDHEGRIIRYEWDALSRRAGIVYPDESRIEYRYNMSGKLGTVSSEFGDTRYIYDPTGRLKERKLPEGVTTQYIWDSLGRLSGLIHLKDDIVTDNFNYSYDPVGNIIGIDKRRRDMETDSGLFRYVYDPAGRLTEATHGQEKREYQYDSLGNRIMSSRNGIPTYYSYNARNQLKRSWTEEDIREYGYDARGNLIQMTENGTIIEQYSYDATNCLMEVVASDSNRTEYVYNGFLRRVKKRENIDYTILPHDINCHDILHKKLLPPLQQDLSDEERPQVNELSYIMDLTRLYNDILAVEGEKSQRFIWGESLLMAEGESPLIYLCDHLGSPIRIFREDQEKALAYDEFGMTARGNDDSSSICNYFGYTGEYTDVETNNVYLRARYYSPVTGRFLSEDTYKGDFKDPLSLNLYAFCWNNPVSNVDPSGHDPTPSWAMRINNGQGTEEDFGKALAFASSGKISAYAGAAERRINSAIEKAQVYSNINSTYNISYWNTADYQSFTNCYAYAFNVLTNPLTENKFPVGGMQPGMLSDGEL